MYCCVDLFFVVDHVLETLAHGAKLVRETIFDKVLYPFGSTC